MRSSRFSISVLPLILLVPILTSCHPIPKSEDLTPSIRQKIAAAKVSNGDVSNELDDILKSVEANSEHFNEYKAYVETHKNDWFGPRFYETRFHLFLGGGLILLAIILAKIGGTTLGGGTGGMLTLVFHLIWGGVTFGVHWIIMGIDWILARRKGVANAKVISIDKPQTLAT